MKPAKTFLVLSSFLVIVVLLSSVFKGQHEFTGEKKVIYPSARHETNPAQYAGISRSIHFEPNLGQADNSASFIARGHEYCLFLKGTGAVLAFHNTVNRMQLEGSNPHPLIKGCDQLTAKTNYFIGNDPAKWISNIPNYARVVYKEIYPGIDLAFYGNEGELEYDFIVVPGSDPHHCPEI